MQFIRCSLKEVLTVFFILTVSSCKDEPVPTNVFTGAISFNATLSSSEPFANYTGEYQAMYNVGARGVQTAAPWASLNPTGSTFDFAPVSNPYFGMSVLKAQGFESIFLNIPIITIDKRSMPADIVALNFNDAIVKSRFRALIDVLKDKINDKVNTLHWEMK